MGILLGESKLLFWINYHRAIVKDKLISDKTDICIEGFQRSGNNFFYSFFKRHNRPKDVSHHTHYAQNVIKAINQKLPTVVLIRHPLDALASLITYDDRLSLRVATLAYLRYYRKLIPFLDKLLLVDFTDVISEPDRVIERINDRFGTNYKQSGFTDEEIQQFLNQKKERNKSLGDKSPYPNAEKNRTNKKNKALIEKHQGYKKCLKLYQQYQELIRNQTT